MRRSKTQKIAQGHHTEREWQQKFFASNMRCFYCGDPLTLATATKDHKTPICRGGSDEIWNIVQACLPCNQKKGWKTLSEFLQSRPSFGRMILENSQPIGGVPIRKTGTSFEERADEPGLLKKLKSEREQTSWAWRNPV